jgi:hypothetical protein
LGAVEQPSRGGRAGQTDGERSDERRAQTVRPP